MAASGMVPFKQINPRNRKVPAQPYFLQLGGQPKAMPLDYDQLRMSRALQISQISNPSIVQNVFVQALIPLKKKGDLLTRNATDNVALPVGTDGQLLIADSTQATGNRWGDYYYTPHDFRMRTWYAPTNSGASLFSPFYEGTSLAFSGTNASFQEAGGKYVSWTTAAALNAEAGVEAAGVPGFTRPNRNPRMSGRFRTGSSLAGVRWFFGWCYGDPVNFFNATGIYSFGLGYDSATSANWLAILQNNTHISILATSIPVAANTVYNLTIDAHTWATDNVANFYVNGVLAKSVADAVNINATQDLDPCWKIMSIDGAAKVFYMGPIQHDSY